MFCDHFFSFSPSVGYLTCANFVDFLLLLQYCLSFQFTTKTQVPLNIVRNFVLLRKLYKYCQPKEKITSRYMHIHTMPQWTCDSHKATLMLKICYLFFVRITSFNHLCFIVVLFLFRFLNLIHGDFCSLFYLCWTYTALSIFLSSILSLLRHTYPQCQFRNICVTKYFKDLLFRLRRQLCTPVTFAEFAFHSNNLVRELIVFRGYPS